VEEQLIIDDDELWTITGRRSTMAKGDDIQERLIDCAVEVMELRDALPKTFAGRHIGEQLFRAGTAGAANYAEARGSESKNDFIRMPRRSSAGHVFGVDGARKDL
jgi:hypothetical protein